MTGNNLSTALSPAAQRRPRPGWLGHTGAVVALDPQTGHVLAMASDPASTPRHVPADRASARRPGAPLLNRATQGLYPPGSTFKVVTATAALKSRPLHARHDDRRQRHLHHRERTPLCNAGGEVAGVVTSRARR